MKMITSIQSPVGVSSFTATLYHSAKPEDLMLEAVGFYQILGKKIPAGDHYEIEIIKPDDNFFMEHKLHVHASPKIGGNFVCYPRQIPTIDRAKEVFNMWCLGAVLTVTRGIDLNTVYSGECKGNEELFLSVMREKYGISIIETGFEDYWVEQKAPPTHSP